MQKLHNFLIRNIFWLISLVYSGFTKLKLKRNRNFLLEMTFRKHVIPHWLTPTQWLYFTQNRKEKLIVEGKEKFGKVLVSLTTLNFRLLLWISVNPTRELFIGEAFEHKSSVILGGTKTKLCSFSYFTHCNIVTNEII